MGTGEPSRWKSSSSVRPKTGFRGGCAERLPDLRALGDSPVASMDCVQVGNRQSCCAEVPAMAACVVVRAGRSWHRQPGVSAQGVQRTVHARLAVAARRRAAVGFASARMHDGLR